MKNIKRFNELNEDDGCAKKKCKECGKKKCSCPATNEDMNICLCNKNSEDINESITNERLLKELTYLNEKYDNLNNHVYSNFKKIDSVLFSLDDKIDKLNNKFDNIVKINNLKIK